MILKNYKNQKFKKYINNKIKIMMNRFKIYLKMKVLQKYNLKIKIYLLIKQRLMKKLNSNLMKKI